MYTVPSVDIQECPVSYIGDGVAELVHDLELARTVHAAYGAPVLTEPFLEWPVKMAEVLDILEQERRADEYHAWKASQKKD